MRKCVDDEEYRKMRDCKETKAIQRHAKLCKSHFWKVVSSNPMVVSQAILAIQAFFMMVLMQALTFADENVLYKWFAIDNIGYLLYNFLLFYIVLQTCFCCFRRIMPGYLLLGVITMVISVINNMKWLNLKECVTISDLTKLSEAVQVAGEAEFNVFADTWMFVLVGIVLLFVSGIADYRLIKDIQKDVRKVYVCRIMLFVLGLILIPVVVADAKGSAVAKLTESRSADVTGPVVYFVESIFTSSLDEPYTTQEALASYNQYVNMGKELVEKEEMPAKNKDKQPNIIVIMSEAFFDVNQFEGGLSYSENPMAFYEEVENQSVASGNTRVNIYGGSTHFSEFEFLTGWNSKGMNSGSCPYKEYFNVKQPSLAGYLQEQGYYTLAIHPYDSFFWNRKHAYPNMGFEQFVDRTWMKYTDKCGYISDDALTNEIIYRYEERQTIESPPFFCFGVSIANHVAMINGEEFENTANHIDITYNKNLKYNQRKQQRLKDYIGGISKTGEALKKLTEYFKKQDEPTVIVFFGDHAPNYATDILKAAGKEELSYATPYLIWSNYEMDDEMLCRRLENEDMNVSYLSTYLLYLLNMPLPDQSYYNFAMRNSYLFETRYAVADVDGKDYKEFSSIEKDVYFEHALDMKKQIPALLSNPDYIQDIWRVSN